MLFLLLMLIANVHADCINFDLNEEITLRYEYDNSFTYGETNKELVGEFISMKVKDCKDIEFYYNNTIVAYSKTILYVPPMTFDNNHISREYVLYNCEKLISNLSIKIGWDDYDSTVIYFNNERIYLDNSISTASYSLTDSNQSIISLHQFNKDEYHLSIISDKFPKFWLLFFIGNYDLIGYDNGCSYTDAYYFAYSGIGTFIVLLVILVSCYIYYKLRKGYKGYKLKRFFNKNTIIYSDKKHNNPDNDNNYDTCTICFEDYKNNDVIKILSCSDFHHYHKECIIEWFKRKKKCPLCLQEFNI